MSEVTVSSKALLVLSWWHRRTLSISVETEQEKQTVNVGDRLAQMRETFQELQVAVDERARRFC